MAQDYRKQVFLAMDYISQHLDINLTLAQISREVGVSCFHFHRIFKAQVGETVAEFARSLRMEKPAISLIDAPYSDITGLALQAGFSSSLNFSRAFRRHFSVSPGEFRRCQREGSKSKAGHVIWQKSTYYQNGIIQSDWRAAGGRDVCGFAASPTRCVYASIWAIWKRDMSTNASGTVDLTACQNVVTTCRDAVCVLASARCHG